MASPRMTHEEHQAALEEFLLEQEKKGYRIRETFEKDINGSLTFAGMAQSQDAYAHNILISLRAALDATELGTEAHDTVKALYHDIVSQASHTYRWLQIQEEKNKNLLQSIAALLSVSPDQQ